MIVSFDTETALMVPGLAVPPLSCGSFAYVDGTSKVLGPRDTLNLVTKYLQDPSVVFVGHNIAFDMAVVCAERPELLPLVFQAYADDRFRDTDFRERLINIAQGTFAEDRAEAYSLATLAKQRLKIELDKTTHRHGYGKLIGVPLEIWSEGEIGYAREDAIATLKVYLSQADECDDYVTPHPVHAIWHEHHVCRKAFALMLMRAHGVRVDADRVKTLEATLLSQERDLMRTLVSAGVLEKHPKKDEYTRKTKVLQARVEAVYGRLGRVAPRTDPSGKFPDGQIKTDAETCDVVDPLTGKPADPVLAAAADYVGVGKVLDTFLKPLLAAGGRPINPWWNAQLKSDRTSCSGPNMQNPPKATGVRECIIPGQGLVFSSVDYSTIELVALADFNEKQFGYSAMANQIREGLDLHTELASRLLGIDYAEAKANKARPDVKHARNLAKAVNFGFPGGMGVARFIEQARKGYDLHFTPSEAKSYKDLYLRTNPEMLNFFAHVSALTAGGYGTVVTPGSGLVTGGRTYPAACNQHFQGPVAKGATDALFYVSWECYVDRGTVLYGSRPTMFIHDEIIAAHPVRTAAECAERVGVIMRERMQLIFGVPVATEACLMTRWIKAAEPYKVDGELIPWDAGACIELFKGLRSKSI